MTHSTSPTAPAAIHTCPVCGSADIVHDFDKDNIPYFRCRACAFRFSRPDDNANLREEIEGFEEAYIQYLSPDPADAPNFDRLGRHIERFANLRGTSLLDIGCGGGKWVRYLAEHVGVDAYGVEPCDAVFNHFLAHDPADRFFHGAFPAYRAAYPDRRFDIVTSFDVIEHVHDPAALLRDVAAVLKPGGSAFISCPDVGSITARLLGRHWYHFNRYHLSFLSPATLARAAASAGLKVDHVSHPGRSRPAGYVARHFFEFLLRRRVPRIPAWLDRRFVWINPFDVLFATLSHADAR